MSAGVSGVKARTVSVITSLAFMLAFRQSLVDGVRCLGIVFAMPCVQPSSGSGGLSTVMTFPGWVARRRPLHRQGRTGDQQHHPEKPGGARRKFATMAWRILVHR